MIKDEDDKTFASKLLRDTLNNWENNEKKLEERLENWDLERVSLMDKVILSTALQNLIILLSPLQESLLMNILKLQKYLLQTVPISSLMVF
jgi:transcription termination factor NusB